MPDGVESAFYKLSDPVKQIESMVYNVVLGHVPKMKLDDTFLNQADKGLYAAKREGRNRVVHVEETSPRPDNRVIEETKVPK
jgi:hypothetical protein